MPDSDEELVGATYVEQPGLVAVEAGDQIIAAPGSEAALTVSSAADVHYHFPIHVVVTGDPGDDIKNEIAAEVWNALYTALH
jgi:phosphoribosyl-ATP pyrophosphohydrolase